MLQNPHPDLDQHQSLTTQNRGSPLAHAYHVRSMSVNAFVSYPADSQNERVDDRTNDRRKQSHNSASLGGAEQ